jgi:hypothetical protein
VENDLVLGEPPSTGYGEEAAPVLLGKVSEQRPVHDGIVSPPPPSDRDESGHDRRQTTYDEVVGCLKSRRISFVSTTQVRLVALRYRVLGTRVLKGIAVPYHAML